jgi:protein TonB
MEAPGRIAISFWSRVGNDGRGRGVQDSERRWAMDRVKVLSPAISGTAHAVAAGMLTCMPLFLADRLPAPPSFQPVPQLGSGPVVLLAGGGVPRVEARRTRLTPTLTPARPVLPVDFSLEGVPVASLDLGSVGSRGLGEGLDDQSGFCLFDCGGDPGLPLGAAREASEPVRSPLRVRPGGDIREPVKVRHVNPVYPPLALSARVQGPVVLECVITTEGRVSEIAVVRGHVLLRDAAVAAVSRWRYRPTLLNGVPVSVILSVTVTFSLR